jgi:hypothetical protein
VLGLDIFDAETLERDAVLDECLLERFDGGWSLGSSSSSTPSGSSGETTVSQRNSPTGTSDFFWNPKTSV